MARSVQALPSLRQGRACVGREMLEPSLLGAFTEEEALGRGTAADVASVPFSMSLFRLILISSGLVLAVGPAWAARGLVTEEDRHWWAFQPIIAPAVPSGPAAARPVDCFVLEKLASQALEPAPEASREELCRRLTLDLWGLPPTPAETAAFLADTASGAYERLVDRLLASPHYGERYARHWLDLVRYADSDGYKADAYRPDAWRYRDYVVRSLNLDKSYAQFIQEQLAGDEQPTPTPDALIATGYLRHWIYEYNNRDVAGQRTTILNDITDTTADVFLGLGLQCARCHDHKFDPLLQADYYRLQACFAGFVPLDHTTVATAEERESYRTKQAAWEAATAALRTQIDHLQADYLDKARNKALKLFPEETQALLAKPAVEHTPYEQQLFYLANYQVLYEYNNVEGNIKGTDKEALVALRKQLAEFDKLKPTPLASASTVRDAVAAAPVLIPKREALGDIAPGVPTLLQPEPLPVTASATSTGRRTALAAWLTQPQNPLTARVIVNRVWAWHFGRGLTSTTSDFGHLGEKPSHPELLDWLASEFISHGYSLKHLHRLMVTSATYRQSSNSPVAEAATLADPENRLLWRWRTQRLSAEQIRDALLAATGELDLAVGGPSVDFTKPRRTIYNKVLRNVRDPLLDVFDAPQHFNSTATRDTTTTPVQSLLLINNRQLIERSQALAQRLEKAEATNPSAQIRLAYQLLYNRPPAADELSAAQNFLISQATLLPPQAAPSAPFLAESMPQRDGKAVVLAPHSSQERLLTSIPDPLPAGDFSIESIVLLRSVYDSGELRLIASNWNGDHQQPGWALGITGAKSQRKAQMLALQLVGAGADGKTRYEPIFSDLSIQLDRSYYLAVSVHYGGTVTFYLKDLANDDELLQTTVVPHPIISPQASPERITIGARAGANVSSQWDGLIDEVRLHAELLNAGEHCYLSAGNGFPNSLRACWQFEPTPGFLMDSKSLQATLQSPQAAPQAQLRPSALADLCHAMLNSNEFLYVR